MNFNPIPGVGKFTYPSGFLLISEKISRPQVKAVNFCFVPKLFFFTFKRFIAVNAFSVLFRLVHTFFESFQSLLPLELLPAFVALKRHVCS